MAAAVIGEQTANGNAEAGIVRHGSAQESDGGGGGFIGQDEGEARRK